MKNKSKNIKVTKSYNNGIEYNNLYSYNVYVCCVSFDVNSGELLNITLGKYWDYSITTTKHVYDFLRDFDIDIHNKNIIDNAIENGFINNNDVKIPFYFDYTME